MSKINETNYPRRPQSDYEDTDMLIIQEAGGNTYTTRIEDIREDCQETIAPTVEAVNDALAPPENGSTASQSYAIGEHFMRNGDFCTAIAAITSGGSFTLNTNYVVGTIAETLQTLTSDLTSVANNVKAWHITPEVGDNVTDISVNAGDKGKTLFVIISQQTGAADNTASLVGMLRCGYSGNNVTWTLIAGAFKDPYYAISFSANSNGKLVITQAGAKVSHVMIISNRIGV